LAEPECETRMRGFYLGREAGHVDHFTTVDHAAASCTSDEEYRGVLGDRSSGVFRGRVIVRPDAQKTDARQSNPNLLISDHARVDSKPQLEIYADDIRASHGSTTGQLDPNALFFLRTRGIGAAEAKLLLTRAFAQTIVDGIADDRLREAASARVDDALASLVSATDSADTQDAPVGGSAS
jgi:Fe-S cluster assembly protein SufD